MTYDNVPWDSVLHLMYAPDPETPYRGNGPIAVAQLAGRLSAETVNALANEASGPVGRLLGLPTDGEDETVEGLRQDIGNARGRVAMVETGDWNVPGSGTLELQTRRFGVEPPTALVALSELATKEVCSACGVSLALFGGSDGTALRESWRQLLFGTIAPLGNKVEAELRRKLSPDLTLTWAGLRASELTGRARAVQSLVGGGMELERTVSLAGLLAPD